MDKRKKLQSFQKEMSDGNIILINIYEKKSGYRVTSYSNTGSLDIYVPPHFNMSQLDKVISYLYEQFKKKGLDNVLNRPFMKENVYIYLFGVKRFITNDVKLKDNPAFFYIQGNNSDPINKYKKLFLDYLKVRVVEVGKMMNKDVSDMTIRTGLFIHYFGCCFPQKRMVKFDYRLFGFKPHIIDTIIVHELTHLDFINHDKNFYNMVYKYFPDYDRCLKIIKSGMYESD